MPIYEYHCAKCGRDFEQLHRMLNESAPRCPSCGSSRTSKSFSTFSARVASSATKPCDGGACPASAAGGAAGPCSGGRCPLG